MAKHTNFSIDSGIEKALQFIHDNPNLIQGIYKQVSYNDEPKLYGYSISFKNNHGNADDEADAGGLSFNQKRALIKTLGETLERFSLANNENAFVLNSFTGLVKLNKSALDPKTVFLAPGNNHQVRHLDAAKLHWVEGKFLSSQKNVLVPAQLIYVPYVHHRTEPVLSFPISTGAAAGVKISDALYRAICEVVERDSFMIAYLNKIPSPHVHLPSIKDPTTLSIIEMLARYHLDLVVLDLTTDLQIPTFTAIILDRTGVGPAVSVGLKAGFNTNDTIRGAIEESLMVRFYTRDKITYNSNVKKSKKVITIEDRARFWFPISRISQLDFWLKHKTYKKSETEKLKLSGDYLERAVTLLSQKGMDIIYVDITDKRIKRYGFTVVKVLIPQLQPLFLDERYPYIQKGRLYTTPVDMGLYQKPKRRSELNKIPHPFL